jgi:MbtH protein
VPNPFDDPDAPFLVLVNAEGQHSLWPVPLPVPDGWTVAHGQATRDEAMAWVDAHWTDLRPLPLGEER